MTDETYDFEEVRADAHRLIDLAYFLLPEGEGMDLSDEDYTVGYIAELKAVLGNMRSGIDLVTKALAQVWHELDPGAKMLVGNTMYSTGYNTKKVWVHDDGGLAFAKWLKKQPAETVAAIVAPASIRVTPLGAARNTFLDELKTSDQLTIKSRKVD